MGLHGRALGIFLCLGLASAWAAPEDAGGWPFDQRQILLTSTQGQKFPDERIVAQFMDVFVRKGRVRWVTRKGGPGQILPVEVPADFPWHSADAVRELGKKYKVDGVVMLMERGVQVDMRWYASQDGRPLFYENASLPEAVGKEQDEQRKRRINDWLEDVWSRIPGQGYVVKRDMNTLSIEGAQQEGAKVGDTLELTRLQEAKRHPVLKTLVEIKSSTTGRGTVTALGEPFSTVRVDFESETDPIQPGDRYVMKRNQASVTSATPPAALLPDAPAPMAGAVDANGRRYIPLTGGPATPEAPNESAEASSTHSEEGPKYKLVDLDARLQFSTVNHQETVSGVTSPLQLSGMAPGFEIDVRGYITTSWILSGEVSYAFLKFGDPPSNYSASSISSSVFAFRAHGGYRLTFLKDGPLPGELVISAGYRRYSISFESLSVSVAPQSKAFGGIEVGIALQVPIYGGFAAQLRGTRILATSLTEEPETAGNTSSSSILEFGGGVVYALSPSSRITGGVALFNSTTNYTGTGTRATASTSSSLGSTTFMAGYQHKF